MDLGAAEVLARKIAARSLPPGSCHLHRSEVTESNAASLCICHNADCTSTRDDKAAKPPVMRHKTDAPEIAISMHLS